MNDPKQTLQSLLPVFAKASIGDFSENVEIPDGDDEYAQLCTGIQIMLDVIRDKLAEHEKTEAAYIGRTRELELAKAKIEQEKSKIETILTSIGDGVFAVDFEGNIILVNNVAQQLSGYNAKESLGEKYSQIFHLVLEKNPEVTCPDFVEEVIRTRTMRGMSNHILLISRDGTKIPISDSAAPLLDSQGIAFGCVVILRDVTRERDLERTKDEFLSLAAHELRTPLGSMRWNLEMLLAGDKGELKPAIKDSINRLYASDLRLILLVNDLLNVSRIQQGKDTYKPEPVDFIEATIRVIREMEEEAKRRFISIELSYDETIELKTTIDPKHFHQIMLNLLSNAIKYSNSHGKVSIDLTRKGDTIGISVQDRGIGISRADRGKIFSKFFRSVRAIRLDTQGSGLGLFAVKSYIDRCHGKIWFESKEGKGTTFFLEFPVIQDERPSQKSLPPVAVTSGPAMTNSV